MTSDSQDGRPAILTLDPPRFAKEEFEVLKQKYVIDTVPATNHPDTARAISEAVKARALLGASPYKACVWFFGNSPYAPFDEDLLGPLAEAGCGFFSGGGAGYDDADTEWMNEVGAYYANTPNSVTASTATGTLMLILAATRALSHAEIYTKTGKWRGDDEPNPEDKVPIGFDVEGCQLGIIGMGAIGKQLAVRSVACGMNVVYYNRNPLPDSDTFGAKYLSMDELLATSDIISINCPLNSSTRHLIGPTEFAKMKDGVFFVNTARGPIVDEKALVEALKSGKVLRAGLDVFEREPLIHEGLLHPSIAKRVTMLPHNAARTQQTLLKGEREILKSLSEFMQGRRPEYTVNEPKTRRQMTES